MVLLPFDSQDYQAPKREKEETKREEQMISLGRGRRARSCAGCAGEGPPWQGGRGSSGASPGVRGVPRGHAGGLAARCGPFAPLPRRRGVPGAGPGGARPYHS